MIISANTDELESNSAPAAYAALSVQMPKP